MDRSLTSKVQDKESSLKYLCATTKCKEIYSQPNAPETFQSRTYHLCEKASTIQNSTGFVIQFDNGDSAYESHDVIHTEMSSSGFTLSTGGIATGLLLPLPEIDSIEITELTATTVIEVIEEKPIFEEEKPIFDSIKLYLDNNIAIDLNSIDLDVLVNILLDVGVDFKKDTIPTVADVLPEVIKMMATQFGEIYTPGDIHNCCHDFVLLEDLEDLETEDILEYNESATVLLEHKIQDALEILSSSKNLDKSIEEAKADSKQMKESAELTLKTATDYDDLVHKIEEKQNAREAARQRRCQIEDEADDEEGGNMPNVEMLVKHVLRDLVQLDSEKLKMALDLVDDVKPKINDLSVKFNELPPLNEADLAIILSVDGPIVEKALEYLPRVIDAIAGWFESY